MAARQAAAAEKRGGGERGLIERRKFSGLSTGTNGSKLVEAETVTVAGSTKTTGAIAGRSGLWQQDMEQEAMPGASWPQSMAFSEAACECC